MRRAFLAALLIGAITGCDSTKSPGTASLQSASLTGKWAGDLTLIGQTPRMTWTLVQTGSMVTGPVVVALPNGTVLLNASLSGVLTDTTLAYVMTFGSGGIPSQPSCTGELAGSVSVSGNPPKTLSGTYTLTSSTCGTGFSTGGFTLTKTAN